MTTIKRSGEVNLRVETTGIMAMGVVVLHRLHRRTVSRGDDDALIVDVDGQGKSKGEGNGVRNQAGRGAQFPMPWDLFDQLDNPIDHRDCRMHGVVRVGVSILSGVGACGTE